MLRTSGVKQFIGFTRVEVVALRPKLIVQFARHEHQALMRAKYLVETECVTIDTESTQITNFVRRIGNRIDKHARRRVLSISYCAGWLRPVENSFLNLSPTTVSTLPEKLQAILGYAAHDATANRGGMVGLYENGDPARALPAAS